MKLPKFLVIIFLLVVFILLIEVVYYAVFSNFSIPKISIENNLQDLSIGINPEYSEKDITTLLKKYSKKEVQLVVSSSKDNVPKSSDGSLAGLVDGNSNQVMFDANSNYSPDGTKVSYFFHPNLDYYKNKEGGFVKLSRLLSDQILRAIIATDNKYLFSGESRIEIPTDITEKFIIKKTLVLVSIKNK